MALALKPGMAPFKSSLIVLSALVTGLAACGPREVVVLRPMGGNSPTAPDLFDYAEEVPDTVVDVVFHGKSEFSEAILGAGVRARIKTLDRANVDSRFLFKDELGLAAPLDASRVLARDPQTCPRTPTESACGFSLKDGYPKGGQKLCRLTYSLPDTGLDVAASGLFYTNCNTCREAVLNSVKSAEGSITALFKRRCSGTPRLDEEWRSKFSFKVDTVSKESVCALESQYFSFDRCRDVR